MSVPAVDVISLSRRRTVAWWLTPALAGVALVTVLLLGLGLRFLWLDAKSLWYDEAASLYFASPPLPELIRLTIMRDTPPPLYYLALHGWMSLFGDGVFAVRALSALASALCLPLLYALGRALTDRATALLATGLLALSPFHIWYAQETRMYALLALTGLASTLALVRLLQRPGWGRWLIYVGATGAMLWVHYLALFTLAAQAVVVLALAWPGQPATGARRWLWTAVPVAGLTLLPWAPAFLIQSQTYRRFWIPPATPETLEKALWEFSAYHAPYWRLPGDRPGLVVIGFLALAIAGGLALRRQGRLAWLLPVALALLPVALAYVVGSFRPLFLARTLILVTPFYLLLVAAGLVELARLGWRRLAAGDGDGQVGAGRAWLARGWPLALASLGLLWVVGWTALSLQNLYRNAPKEPWDEAARLVAQHAGAGDVLIFHSAPGEWPFTYYFSRLGHTLPMHGIPHDADQPTGALEVPVTPADIAAMEPLLNHDGPVWLVLSHEEFNDPTGMVQRAFDARWRLDEHQTLYNIELRRYVPAG
ncbi:MAG: glycosyltransferase family 39 protein [Chloroflexi bacterium]|nr:glycosyltransferase family 39 protein [Chloroflexota bacterium]